MKREKVQLSPAEIQTEGLKAVESINRTMHALIMLLLSPLAIEVKCGIEDPDDFLVRFRAVMDPIEQMASFEVITELFEENEWLAAIFDRARVLPCYYLPGSGFVQEYVQLVRLEEVEAAFRSQAEEVQA